MSYKILVERKAVRDTAAIIRWYQDQSAAAAASFEKECITAFDLIAREEVNYRIVYKKIQLFRLHTFPYNIYFITDEEHQCRKIIAILHRKQDQQRALESL